MLMIKINLRLDNPPWDTPNPHLRIITKTRSSDIKPGRKRSVTAEDANTKPDVPYNGEETMATK